MNHYLTDDLLETGIANKYPGYPVLISGYLLHGDQHTAAGLQLPSSSQLDGYGSCGTAGPMAMLPAHQ
jgi:hypothetical protein